MIQKIFEKNFFGLNASKWSNSKSYDVKSEIWRPSKNFPLLGHQSWRLRKIFRKKFFGSNELNKFDKLDKFDTLNMFKKFDKVDKFDKFDKFEKFLKN